jgi:VanZ family protein
MKTMLDTAIRWAFWICLLGILVLSLMPPTPQLPTTGWDKSNHMLAFAVPMLLSRWAYPGRTIKVAVGLLAYGVLIELLQSLTPDRLAEWADLLADGIGLLCGWSVGRAIAWLPALRGVRGARDE